MDNTAPVFKFLLGEGPLRGVEFGDRHPDERGAFWWRKDLRAALAAQPAASAEPSDEELAQVWRQVSGRETLRPDSVAMAFARALLSRYGRPAGDAVAADEITYEIWQDDMMVASSTDPKDASHYAAVYSQDGPVKVYTVLRSEWEGPNGGIVRGAGQMPAGDAQHYEAALRQIGDYAHDHSTGPAVPDALWAVRSLAYGALSDAPVATRKADDARDAIAQRDIAIDMLARWCVAVSENGAGWDDWDEHYKDAAYRPGPLRSLLDAAIAQQRKGED